MTCGSNQNIGIHIEYFASQFSMVNGIGFSFLMSCYTIRNAKKEEKIMDELAEGADKKWLVLIKQLLELVLTRQLVEM